jgi:hypothetical protein
MVAVWIVVTVFVLIVKVKLVALAGMVTVPGLTTALPVTVKDTGKPPDCAGEFSVTVPLTELPPTTVDWERVNVEIVGASTVNVAVLVDPPPLAVIVTLVFAETGVVVTLIGAEVAPAATVTEAADADVLLLVKLTTAPPVGAGPFKVTVPETDVPPLTVVGAVNVNPESAGEFIVRFADAVAPLKVAEIVAVAAAATAVVLTANVAVELPLRTVTEPRTVAEELLLERLITVFAVAAALKVTVPVDEVPPVTAVGLTVTELSEIALNPASVVTAPTYNDPFPPSAGEDGAVFVTLDFHTTPPVDPFRAYTFESLGPRYTVPSAPTAAEDSIGAGCPPVTIWLVNARAWAPLAVLRAYKLPL